MQHGTRLRLGILKESAPSGARLRGCLDGLLPYLLSMALATWWTCEKEKREECGAHEVCDGVF